MLGSLRTVGRSMCSEIQKRPTIFRTTRSLEVTTLRVFTCFKEESSLKIKIVMSGNIYDKSYAVVCVAPALHP